jgi:hypothetical protein
MAVDEHDTGRPVSGAYEFNNRHLGGFGTNRKRAGKALMFTTGSNAKRWAIMPLTVLAKPLATARAILVSVSSGRCGPCCSHEPTGITTTGGTVLANWVHVKLPKGSWLAFTGSRSWRALLGVAPIAQCPNNSIGSSRWFEDQGFSATGNCARGGQGNHAL